MKTEQTLTTEKITANSEQLAVFKNFFPQCFDKQDKFIVLKLQEILQADGVEVSRESYSLNWLGKSYARVLANEPIRTMLSEDTDHNEQEQNKNSHNLLIQGDNLEVLKHLKGAYTDKVKMIYIDPPYNTGSDGFVYQDDRSFTPEQFSELAGIDIDEAKRVLSFTQSNANSHSAWLTFIYPRLYIAKQLMKDDGVIFISIDDNEQAQLKILCDEIFGEQNFIGNIVWKNATDNNPTNIAIEHEYLLAYALDKSKLESVWKSSISATKSNLVELGKTILANSANLDEAKKTYTKWFREHKYELGTLDRYKYIDEDGIYTGSQSVHNPGKEGYRYDVIHPVTQKPCKEPLNGYRFPKSTMDKLLASGKILFGQNEDKIIELKVYAEDYVDKLSSLIELDGRLGTYSITSLLGNGKIFTNAKPVELLSKLLSYIGSSEDYYLDFFSGSGSFAEAIIQLNYEDNKNRKFICVQIPELIESSKDAYKAGYRTIFEITKDRIIKADEKLAQDYPESGFERGFKIFKTCEKFLPSSSYRDLKQLTLEQTNTPVVTTGFDEAQLQDILTTWKGLDKILLSENLHTISLGNYIAYGLGHVLYLVNKDFNTDALKVLIQKLDDEHEFQVSKLVILGHHFDSKAQREIDEAMKNYSNKKSIPVDVVVRY
ncbi:site-specific DNA-methyltransferase [Acinetobacter baylyi]|uniref:site-specific DNA-methyltransferase n=1 Tax=Acinetobacter baylyi TaxID=202950 RepID=UPI000EA3C0DC|nr:site-specific DNA-methyltransferase [Acinetobacter baylyi]